MILALETSTPHASLALFDSEEDAVIAERTFVSHRGHNSAIFAPLAELLDLLADRPLERIVLGTGPGSYGGVRVGIAVATALGIARGVPVLPWPSITTMAPDALVVGDARRGHYYVAEVRACRLTAPPRLCEADVFRDIVAGRAADLDLVTSDATPPGDFPAKLAVPSASILAHIAYHLTEEERLSSEAALPEPIYLRAPYITTPKGAARPTGLT